MVDLISKYALHNTGIAFSLKKQDENILDVHTTKSYSVKDVIRVIYTAAVAREIIHIPPQTDKHGSFEGHITNPNYHKKKQLSYYLLIID